MCIGLLTILAVATLPSPGLLQSTYVVERNSGVIECAFSIRYITFIYRQSNSTAQVCQRSSRSISSVKRA